MSNQLYRRCKHGSFVAHEQITDRGEVSDCHGVVLVNPNYAAAAEERDRQLGTGVLNVTAIVDAALKGADDDST